MSGVDRLMDGSWAACEDVVCPARFHLPDITVAEAAAIPFKILLPLLNLMDPPTQEDGRLQAWRRALPQAHERAEFYSMRPVLHREYDLPALAGADGSLYWYQHNERHRANGQPAVIWPDGSIEFWEQGHNYDNRGPAVRPRFA